MKNESFTPEQSILVLSKMQEQFIKSIQDDGLAWIVQSVAAILLALTHFVLFKSGVSWAPLVWLGMLFSSFWIFKMNKNKTKQVQTQLGGFLKHLWIAFTISLLIIIFSLLHFELYDLIFPLCFVLYGLGIYVNAAILKFKPMYLSALICWLMAIVTFFVHGEQQLLMFVGVMAGGFLMPGILLYRASEKSTNA